MEADHNLPPSLKLTIMSRHVHRNKLSGLPCCIGASLWIGLTAACFVAPLAARAQPAAVTNDVIVGFRTPGGKIDLEVNVGPVTSLGNGPNGFIGNFASLFGTYLSPAWPTTPFGTGAIYWGAIGTAGSTEVFATSVWAGSGILGTAGNSLSWDMSGFGNVYGVANANVQIVSLYGTFNGNTAAPTGDGLSKTVSSSSTGSWTVTGGTGAVAFGAFNPNNFGFAAAIGDYTAQSGANYSALDLYSVTVTGSSFLGTFVLYTSAAGGINAGDLFFIKPAAPPAGTGATTRLVNLSARAAVGTDSNILIAGFIVSGSGNKSMVIRGVGPALTQFGVSNYLAQPSLGLFNAQSAQINSNTGWSNSAALSAAFTQVGAFSYPAGSVDSALQVSVPANQSYTAEVSGGNGGTGVSLAELYDADPSVLSSPSRLVNISARAGVGTGPNILIAGFIVGGTGSETVLVRGVGPTLGTAYGLTGVLANPVLTLFDSQGNVITSNQGWQNPPATPTGAWAGKAAPVDASHATFTKVGAFDLGNGTTDSALVVTLPAGAYTAEISGLNSTTGIALVEIYEDN